MPNPEAAEKPQVCWTVVAAMKRELAPLRRRSIAGLSLVETGIGMHNAAQTLSRWLAGKPLQKVIHIGLAGALSPELECGDLVIAHEVWHTGSVTPTGFLIAAASQVNLDGVNIYQGTVVTRDEMLCRSADKQRLALELPPDTVACVDMESAAIASVCIQQRVPFLIVRSISDRLDEDLPVDFNRFRGRDKSLMISKLLASSALHPGSLPGLLELRRRSRLCAEHLASFVELLVGSRIPSA